MADTHSNMTFTVIITTYKRPDYLIESLESVNKQILQPYEIIVVNDSPDTSYLSTEAIATKLGVKYIVNDQSYGANYSRNRGIDLANGDVIAFLDDDDIWFPEYLSTVKAAYRENTKISGTTCGKRMMHDHSLDVVNKLDTVTEAELKKGNTYCGMSGVTVRREVAARFKFDETLPNGQDWDFFVRIVTSNLYMLNFPVALFYYRLSTAGGITEKTNSMKPQQAKPRLQSALKHQKWLGKQAFSDRVTRQLLEGISKRSYKLGWILLSMQYVGPISTIKHLIKQIKNR